MKHRRRIMIVVVLLMLIVGAILFLKPIIIPILQESRQHALLDARWGMSPSRLEKALGFQISENNAEEFFDIFKISFPTVDKSRFRNMGLVSDDFRLWEHNTKVYFTFFDNKLFQYKAEIEWIDQAELHDQITEHLSGKYGTPTNIDQRKVNSFIHDAEWVMDEVKIEYWLVKDTPKTSGRDTNYTARVRATYLPLEKIIQDEAKQEEDKIF